MTLLDLFNDVENREFAARINILSGFRIFLLVLSRDETLARLVDALKESPEKSHEVFQRLLNLLPANKQPDYAHPYDAALAGYLYVLNQVDPTLGQAAADHILETPQLWWARQLAKHIRESVSASESQVEER